MSKVYTNKQLTGSRATLAFQSLCEFTDIIPQSFLTYGTCLASHREKEFIAWDTDVDTGILESDFKWSYINKLLKSGFEITSIYGSPYYGLQFAFYKNVKIDLWIFYLQDNIYYNCLWDNQRDIKHVYPKQLLQTEEGILYNKSFSTLSKEYLTHVYGDWNKPQKQFSWKTDHKCVIGKSFI